MVCAEDAPRKKPDPQVYLEALRRLGRAPDEVLAIEDSSPGVQACLAAGVAVVVTRSVYFAQADVAGALAVGPGLGSRAGWRLGSGADAGATDGSPARVDLACLGRWFAARPV